MEKYILLASLILAVISSAFSLNRQHQMLQQNSYFLSRYFKWVKENYVLPLTFCSMLFCISSVLYLAEKFILQALLFALLLSVRIIRAKSYHKKSIKKLVYTARIKRLIFTESAFLILITALAFVFWGKLSGEILSVIILMISTLSPLTMLLGFLINKPVEFLIGRYFINDAKKILKSHKDLTVIGVTGSFGKTTTKFILNRILSEKFNTVCTPQSYNTPMGAVRTIRESLKAGTQIFICEMGAKNTGDIKEICKIVSPDFGIITSVGAQHLDTFGSIENVFKTKFELADFVRKKSGKTYVFSDSEGIKQYCDFGDKSIIAVGNGRDYFATDISYNQNGSSFTLCLKDTKIKVTTALLGLHSVSDILIASALAFDLGVDKDSIKIAIASLKPAEHRLEIKPFYKSFLIDDAYNSNPEGCLEAVRVLSHFEGMQKTIITPGLIELGAKEYEANYNLGLACAEYCDNIILVGQKRSVPLADAIATTDFNKENLHIASSFKEAMDIYLKTADENSVVLLENDLPDNYLK